MAILTSGLAQEIEGTIDTSRAYSNRRSGENKCGDDKKPTIAAKSKFMPR